MISADVDQGVRKVDGYLLSGRVGGKEEEEEEKEEEEEG